MGVIFDKSHLGGCIQCFDLESAGWCWALGAFGRSRGRRDHHQRGGNRRRQRSDGYDNGKMDGPHVEGNRGQRTDPGAVVDDDYTAGLFGHRAPAFVDRSHRYFDDSATSLSLPAYLVGNEYILSGNDNRDNASYVLDVTVSSPARVYMLIDNRLSDGDARPAVFDATHMQWIIDEGWAATANGWNRAADPSTPDEVAIDEGADDTINQYYSVYSKDFAAGTFSLFQADNAGQNMYGVVVAPVPEPATWVLAVCGLMGLFAVGRFCRR